MWRWGRFHLGFGEDAHPYYLHSAKQPKTTIPQRRVWRGAETTFIQTTRRYPVVAIHHRRGLPVAYLTSAFTNWRSSGVVGLANSSMRDVGNISEEPRQRVRHAIDELGYLPNSLAGSLSSRKSRMVAVIIPSISDIVFSEVLRLNAVLRPRGFQTFIGESHFDPCIEADLLRAMLSFQPAGLLLNGGMARNQDSERLLEKRNCPAIHLWDYNNSDLDFCAGPSHEEAG